MHPVPAFRDIEATLRATKDLMERYGEWHLMPRVDRYIRDLRQRAPTVISSLIAETRGMGSLGDLIICSSNGHKITPDDEAPVNALYRQLMATISHQARALKTSLDGNA